MTTFKQTYIRIDPRVYPHAGTAVEPPDAQVPGVSPAREGLGMDEPPAADRAIRLSKFIKTAPPLVIDLPPLIDHTPHTLEHTFDSDTEAIDWLMHPGQSSASPIHLSTSARCDADLFRGGGLVRPPHQLAAPVGGSTRGHPLFIRAVIYHQAPQDARQERHGHAENATTSADPRLITGAIAARVQGLIEGRWRVCVWASFLALSVAAKSGSRRGQLP